MSLSLTDLQVGDIVRLKNEWVEDDAISHPGRMDCYLGQTMLITDMHDDCFCTSATNEWVFAACWVECVVDKTEKVRSGDIRAGDYVVFYDSLYKAEELWHDLVTDVTTIRARRVGTTDEACVIELTRTQTLRVYRSVGMSEWDNDINIEPPTEYELVKFLFGARK